MKIDTENLHFWMQAIRQSTNPMRTMDAFWSGQIKSKEWLIDKIEPYVIGNVTIDINGGWVGVLASMLFQTYPNIKHIRNIDIDSECKSISETMNKQEEISGKFTAVTADMCAIYSNADIIINTSCEHITQEQYESWLSSCCDKNSILVLQSNNYNIEEHIRISETLEDFISLCNLKTILWAGSLKLPLYDRWMVIGKNV